jgi:hypothetical protein
MASRRISLKSFQCTSIFALVQRGTRESKARGSARTDWRNDMTRLRAETRLKMKEV